MNKVINSILLLFLITVFSLMALSYFGDIHSGSGFAKHQIVAHIGYFLSLGQMDYSLLHWVTSEHAGFQNWVRPVYAKLAVLFLFWFMLSWYICNYYKRK